jgi:hypothetical protein
VTHPNGSYAAPGQERFQLQRSYIKTVRWSFISGLSFSGVGSEWVLTYPPIPGYVAHVKLWDDFWNWTSSRWNLHEIVEHCYEQYLPDLTELPANLTIAARRDTGRGEFLLELVTFAPSQILYYNLPGRTNPYWTPDPVATP